MTNAVIWPASELCRVKRVIDCYDSTSAGRSLCAEDVCEISRLHRHRHPRARCRRWRQHCRFQHRQRTHAAATVGTRGRAGRCLQPRPHQAGRVSRVLVSELRRYSRWQRSLRRRPRGARAHLHDGGNAGRRRNAANAGGPDFLELLRHAGRHARRRAHVHCGGGTPRRRDSRRHRHLRALAARTARSSLHRQDDQGQFPGLHGRRHRAAGVHRDNGVAVRGCLSPAWSLRHHHYGSGEEQQQAAGRSVEQQLDTRRPFETWPQ